MPAAPNIACKSVTADDKRLTVGALELREGAALILAISDCLDVHSNFLVHNVAPRVTTIAINQQVYAVTIDDGPCMQKKFCEFERLFERVKDLLPATLTAPPKKKMLQSEGKLIEKRRTWIEAFSVEVLSNHPKNEHVQEFFALINGDQDESHVDLGPSEVKSTRPSDFDFIKTVGKGSFGRVFVVRHKGDKKIYAMKVLQKEYIRKKNEVKHVMAERNVLKANVNHPFLVNLHFSFQTKDKLYFVLDYLQGGEVSFFPSSLVGQLFSHLQREKRFNEGRARFYAADIASALGYLHEHNIIYRDLKPENLLLDRHGYIVLTDFGLCKENIKAKDTTDTFCGTPEYLAPEIILKKPYDRTVDWWCLGSVLFEMLFGLPPFYSKDHNEMYEKIVNQPLRMRHSISAASTDIISGLLQKDRLKRLGAKRDFLDIKEHPFFMPIDWDKLLKRQLKAPYIPKIKDESDVTNFDVSFTNEKINPYLIVTRKRALLYFMCCKSGESQKGLLKLFKQLCTTPIVCTYFDKLKFDQ